MFHMPVEAPKRSRRRTALTLSAALFVSGCSDIPFFERSDTSSVTSEHVNAYLEYANNQVLTMPLPTQVKRSSTFNTQGEKENKYVTEKEKTKVILVNSDSNIVRAEFELTKDEKTININYKRNANNTWTIYRTTYPEGKPYSAKSAGDFYTTGDYAKLLGYQFAELKKYSNEALQNILN